MPRPPLTRLALSGCGWLFPYHIGVLSYLKSHQWVTPSTILSGVSGGALVAVGEASGLSEQDMMDVAVDIVRRQYSTTNTTSIWGNIGATVGASLDLALPNDAHIKCNSRVSIAVTQVSDEDSSYFVPLMSCLPLAPNNVWSDPTMFGYNTDEEHHFLNKDDLIQGCLASSHIPFYMDKKFSKKWRDSSWVDGGMKNILPPMPEQEDQSSCVQSLPYSIMTTFRNDTCTIVTPASFEFNLVTELLPWSFVPCKDISNLQRLRDVGYKNAELFMDKQQAQYR